MAQRLRLRKALADSVASHAATATAARPTISRRVAAARKRVRRDSRQRGREDGEQHPERVPLHASSVLPYSGGSSGNPLGTLANRHRGVAQLVERRSPKP